MSKIYVFLADGFEDIEALATADILRRGKQPVTLVSMNTTREVCSANGLTVLADKLFTDCDYSDAKLLILPGGMPGAQHLYEHTGLRSVLAAHLQAEKYTAAICAAPMVLGRNGWLEGKRATCYPGFESELKGATYTGELVEMDGHIITAEGPAASFPFAYHLLQLFISDAAVQEIRDGMRYTHLMQEKN